MASNIHWCIKSVDGKDGSVSHNAKLVKNGHTRTGKQRYKCLQCGKTMLVEYTNNACSLGIDVDIIKLTKEGLKCVSMT
jgi:insertion element IS1 protein InsB